MATCLLCPLEDNQVPDEMVLEHAQIMHSGEIDARNSGRHGVLREVHARLIAEAAVYQGTPEYLAAQKAFDAKPLDVNRLYKFARMVEFVAGIEAAAHIIEHMAMEG